MFAKVIASTNVFNFPRLIGDVLEVDEATFRNLAAKGRLAPSDGPATVAGGPERKPIPAALPKKRR